MQRNRPVSPEQLNAYVDGELSSADSAAVARSAARSPAVAAQIATLREMKAAVADLAPDTELRLPARPRSALARTVLAAAAAVVLLVLAGGLYLYPWQAGDAGAEWARALETRHAAWTFTTTSAEMPVAPASGVAALLPLDLGAARLTFAGREDVTLNGRPVHRIGYEGTRGCRVSLFVFAPEITPDKQAFAPSLLARSWVIRDRGFALMADGMDRKRFAGIAAAVERALRSGDELDSGTRQRLALARRVSPPCRA